MIKDDWESYERLSGAALAHLEAITGVDCTRLPIRVHRWESGFEYVAPMMMDGRAVALQYFDKNGHAMIDADETGKILNDARIELKGNDGVIVASDILIGIQKHKQTGLTVYIPLMLGSAEPDEPCAVVARSSDNYSVERDAFEFAAKNPAMVKSVVITRV